MDSNGMHFKERGSGARALVFLHYFGGAGNSWDAVTAELVPANRCIAPDLCGFGYSAGTTKALGVADYADEVCRLIESLTLEEYALVGHSMGGKIALAIAARRPRGLQSLVLVAPSPPSPEPLSDRDRAELLQMFGNREKIEAHLRKISAQLLSPAMLMKETANQLRASYTAWRAWLEGGSYEDISGRMRVIEVPVLVLGGAADKGITPELLASKVVALLSDARLHIMADTGHLLPLEQPHAVAAAIQSWLLPIKVE